MKTLFKKNLIIMAVICLAIIIMCALMGMFSAAMNEQLAQQAADGLVTTAIIYVAAICVVLVAASAYVLISSMKIVKAGAMRNARREFLLRMSHEIRTPLNGIIGLNHLMEQHMDDPEKLKEYNMKMGRTSQYLLAMINDILDINQMASGSIHLVAQPYALEALTEELYLHQKNLMERNGVEFHMEKEITSPYVVGDIDRVSQVVQNLLSNANKYTPRGGRVDFIIRQSEPADGIVNNIFIVRDTGCGMSKNFTEHIFEAFTQESAGREKPKGNGLGMAISYQLVQAMGGTIAVDSTLKQGSTFTVTLPSKIADREQIKSAHESKEKEKLQGLKILVAEDNVLNADILMEILADEGAVATLAVNGQEAVDAFSRSEAGYYDFILMDMQMPIMNGQEAAKAIRALDRPDAKTVRIFACTANSFKEDEEAAYEAGMDDFITKPVDLKVLFYKLNTK